MLADRMRMAASGGITPVTVTHTDNSVSASDLTVYTFSSQAIGIADATSGQTRKVVIGTMMLQSAAGTPAVSSITIGGVSATRIDGLVQGGAVVEMWWAAVPTGTTADVVVTWNKQAISCGIGVWATYDADSVLASDTDDNANSDPVSVTIANAAGGAIIGYVGDYGTSTMTWTELTEDFDEIVEASRSQSGASKEYAVAGTPTITADPTGSSTTIMVIASFSP